ncbi:MAG: SRPBCC domain-containing protein [Streptosporangiaceae bacterium]
MTFSDPGGLGADFSGEVRACEPPRLLEFSWGTDIIRLEVEPAGDGCVLTLLNTLEALGTGARNAAGWHECLDLLECLLAGEAPGFRPGQRWAQVHPRYVQSLGPGAAEIGPPPGFEPTAR